MLQMFDKMLSLITRVSNTKHVTAVPCMTEMTTDVTVTANK